MLWRKEQKIFPENAEAGGELLYPFPCRNFSQEELAYGLWIGMAYSTSAPHENGYVRMKMCKFDFYSVSHLYQGQGKIRIGRQREMILRPGDCIVIPPDTPNRYGSYGNNLFFEDSVKFSGPVADMMYSAGVIRTGVYHLGQTRLLRQIVEFMEVPSVKKRLHAALLLQNFLMNLYLAGNVDVPDPGIEVLLKMIQDVPEKRWHLEEMAGLCQVSKNQLRRTFLEHTGMTPKFYVDSRKIHAAAELLKSTELSVRKIAAQFGWNDPYHFSRRFKQLTGLAPDHYRLQQNEAANRDAIPKITKEE